MATGGGGPVQASNGSDSDGGRGGEKHTPETSFNIPDTPAGGTIHGIAFKPTTVELDGGSLTFSQGEDFIPDLQMGISLHLQGEESVDGRTFEVTNPEKFIKPHVSLRWKPEGESFPNSGFVEKYVMRIVFGDREQRSIDGKLELRSLDEGDETRLAGTFTAKIAPDLSKPPTELDRPYVFGKLALSGAEKYKLTAGIVGLSQEGKRVGNLAGTTFEAAAGGSVASTTFKPQITAVTGTPEGLLYRHIVLQPGTYLVYVLHDDKLADWRWLTIEDAEAEVTQGLRVDTSKRGTLAVTSTADEGTPVALTPLDENGELPEIAAKLDVPSQLKLSAKIEGGKATFTDIAPGRYQLQVGERTTKAEIRAGETTELSGK
jgi:hypothetical protein